MSIQGKVDLNILRYANCWEDADILLEGLSLQREKSILCIASAGDNAIALLSTAPLNVHAIDLSPVQLYTTELKQAAFAVLDHNEILSFLGVCPASSAQRTRQYQNLKNKLSASATGFWDDHKSWIEKGIIHQGKFENYFSFFRNYLLPLVHSRKTVDDLFKITSAEHQQRFYNNKWNTWRWKLLMNVFFSKAVMGKYGRDPEFFKYVNVPVSEYIRTKAEAHLAASLPKDNYFLDMIFNGNFNHRLPFYLRQENFEKIRHNIHNLSFSLESAETCITTNKYDSYVFSNIFEYVSAEAFNDFAVRSADYIPSGSSIALWNLMAPRSFSQAAPGAFELNKDLSERLSAKDKGFFYSRFIVEKRI